MNNCPITIKYCDKVIAAPRIVWCLKNKRFYFLPCCFVSFWFEVILYLTFLSVWFLLSDFLPKYLYYLHTFKIWIQIAHDGHLDCQDDHCCGHDRRCTVAIRLIKITFQKIKMVRKVKRMVKIVSSVFHTIIRMVRLVKTVLRMVKLVIKMVLVVIDIVYNIVRTVVRLVVIWVRMVLSQLWIITESNRFPIN